MTISSTTSKVSYSGNGTTQTFAIPFYFLANADIVVIVADADGVETTKALTTDYVLTGAGVPAGGSCLMDVAPATGETLVIKRSPAQTQETDYVENAAFPAEAHERALDRLTMIAQDLQEQVSRAVLVDVSSGTDPADLLDELAADVAAAAASAATAAASVGKLSGTSTTSVSIGTGSKSFVTQASKFFDVGTWLVISSAADPTNYMHGQVTGYTGTALTVNVTNYGGSGTHTDWAIQVSGTRGATGATGAAGAGTGDMLKAENLSGLANYTTARSNMGLGNAATKDVGTTTGTVCAGDDSRLSVAAPAGMVIAFAGETAPTGYLECNGAAVSRSTYSALFAVIGTAHGYGDNSTTFNVPDYRGRFLRGWAHGQTTDPDKASRTAMNTGGHTGDHVGSVQADGYKAHTHNGLALGSPGGSTGGVLGWSGYDPQTAATSSAGGNETRPVNANVMYCIKH